MCYPVFFVVIQGSELSAHFLALMYALLTDQMNRAARWTVIHSAAKMNCGQLDVNQWSLDAEATLGSDRDPALAPIPSGVAIFAVNIMVNVSNVRHMKGLKVTAKYADQIYVQKKKRFKKMVHVLSVAEYNRYITPTTIIEPSQK